MDAHNHMSQARHCDCLAALKLSYLAESLSPLGGGMGMD